MVKKASKKKPKGTIERIMDTNKIDYYYANCNFIRTTVQDFAISFGVNIFDDQNNKIIEIYEKTIRMSPQQTKLLFNSLKKLLDNYEDKFGEIKVDIKKEKK